MAIIQNREDLLRVECADVLPEEVGELVELLEKELANSARLGNPGVGLAASQVGVAKKIAIVRAGKEQLNLVNAKIESAYDPQMFRDEGCLSWPGRVENTMRFQEVHITGNLVFPHGLIATGLFAVICQHELDHLNQKLFFDYKIQAPKVRPNDACVCNSGKKFKKCCMEKIK